jgi:hypothetical protein
MRKRVLALSLVLELAALLGGDAAFPQCIIPAQTAAVKTTSYAALAADAGKMIVMNCASNCTLTLPSTPQSPNWTVWVASIGAGTATVSPNGLNINGSSSSLNIPQGVGEGFMISTDNSNYFAASVNVGFYAAGGGTAQAQTITLNPPVASLVAGMFVAWKPAAANTAAAPTLAVNGLAATAITKNGTAALVANDLTTTAIAYAIYDGTEFQLLNPQATNEGSVASRRVCDIAIGDASAASAITNAQLGPQKRVCFIPAAGIVQEIDVDADAGTPNVIVGYRNPATTLVNLLSGALATGAAGVNACSNTGGTLGIDATTTCTNTLQNTAVAAGGFFELVSGTAGGTAKLMTVHVVWTVN